ncbi:MAG TPA: hypothetical protein VME86_05995 [Acidobacteriaceae bacterium]|nr:hypothetical protein [Acidobacteriaceae bacterium]
MTIFSANPSSICLVNVPSQPSGVAYYYGVGREALGDNRICPDHTVSANDQFTLVANDGRAFTDPAAFLYSNATAFCHSLVANRKMSVSIRLTVVLNQYGRSSYDIGA